VVQDATIRHAAYDDAGMGNEQYMGVEFVDGPEDADFNVALGCTLRFRQYKALTTRLQPLTQLSLFVRAVALLRTAH